MPKAKTGQSFSLDKWEKDHTLKKNILPMWCRSEVYINWYETLKIMRSLVF